MLEMPLPPYSTFGRQNELLTARPCPFDGLQMSVTRLNPESALEQFYDDLPREEAEKWISQLQPFAAGASTVKTPYSAPHHSEWTSKYRYVEMTKDNAISLSLQRAAAGDMRREPALDRGHSAFLSKPRETAESIRWCIEDIRGNS